MSEIWHVGSTPAATASKMGKLNGEIIPYKEWRDYLNQDAKVIQRGFDSPWPGGAGKCKIVIGDVSLYFYFRELIAFESPETGLLISHSHGSSGRGMALNRLNRDKKIRLDIRELHQQVTQYFIEKGMVNG